MVVLFFVPEICNDVNNVALYTNINIEGNTWIFSERRQN